MSQSCPACGRLAWTKPVPCPACPDFSQRVLLPSGVAESPAASVLPEAVLSPADRQVLQEAVSLLSAVLPRHQPQQVFASPDDPGRERVLCSCGQSYDRPATGPDLAREAARLAHVVKAEFRPEEGA